MYCLLRTLPRVLALRAHHYALSAGVVPAVKFSTSPSALAGSADRSSESSPPSQSPRMQDKDQIQAEKQADNPEKMANLGDEANSKRDGVLGDARTPGVKGKSPKDEPLGRNVSNKATG